MEPRRRWSAWRATAVGLVASLTMLTGCGSGDGDGTGGPGDGLPTADGIVQILEGQGMEPDMAECMGTAYESAGFTADELRSMADEPLDANSEKYQRFAQEAAACTLTDISEPAG